MIDQPVLRLVSVDLNTTAGITALDEFDFAKDYLGLLKAAVIPASCRPASGRAAVERPVGASWGLGAASSW